MRCVLLAEYIGRAGSLPWWVNAVFSLAVLRWAQRPDRAGRRGVAWHYLMCMGCTLHVASSGGGSRENSWERSRTFFLLVVFSPLRFERYSLSPHSS